MTPLLTAAGIRNGASVVHIDGGRVAQAHCGAGADTVYEIGSLTKTMTAAIFARAVETGGLTAQTPLGSLLDLDPSPAADVTLEELASHRSGLPRLATRPRDVAGILDAVKRRRNPYTADVATLLAQARSAKVTDRGQFSYSNLGAALLGQALSAHAGIEYPQLLHRQLFEPLAMDQSTTPLTMHDLRPGAPTGCGADGKRQQAWTMNAYAPAGGVRSTPDDLTRYAKALLDGCAPGISAMEPRWEAGEGRRVGYAWFTDIIDDYRLTWHNGGTGGFSSALVLDRERGAAVLVLAAMAVPVDEIAVLVLLGGQ